MVKDNFKEIRRMLWIILFVNLMVAVLKITLGTLVNSTSITADGVNSLSCGSSNFISIIGIGLACKPVDKDHPYGHKKFETLAGLLISVILIFVGAKIIIDSVVRLFEPVSPNITPESIIPLIAALAVNIFISAYELRNGNSLNSRILVSDSLRTKSNIYISGGVLITLVCIRLGVPVYIDSLVSLAISAIILKTATEIFNSTTY